MSLVAPLLDRSVISKSRVVLAAQYVASAVEETPFCLEVQSVAQASFGRLLNRPVVRRCVRFFVVVIALLAPWTASRILDSDGGNRTARPIGSKRGRKIARALLSGMCSVLVVDCGLQAWIFGSAWYKRGWHQIRACAILVALFNALIFTRVSAGLTAAPAFLVIAEFRPLRRTIASMARTLPTVAPTMALFGGVVAVYSHVGVFIWKKCYDHGWRHYDEDSFDDDLDVEFKGAFDNFGRAAWTLFVLSTTENWPFVSYPAIQCESLGKAAVPLGILYYLSYIFLVVYVLVNTLLASSYSAWKTEHSDLAERERVRIYHALLSAYEVLTLHRCLSFDDDDSHLGGGCVVTPEEKLEGPRRSEKKIDNDLFEALASQLRPKSTSDQRKKAFDFIRQNDHVIGRDAFLRRSRLAFQNILPDIDVKKKEPTVPENELSPRSSRRVEKRSKIRSFLESSFATLVTYGLVLAYLVIEAARETGHAIEVRATLSALLNIIVCIFLVEHIAKRSFSSLKNKNDIHLLDRYLVVVAALCRFLIVPLASVSKDFKTHFLSGPDARRIAGACIAARSFFISAKTRRIANALVRVWRILGLFLVVFALVIYVYAAIAVELCAGMVPGRKHYAYDADDDDDVYDDFAEHTRDRQVLDNRVTFNSLSEAWEGLFRIAVTNNWQDGVNAYLLSPPARKNATVLRRTFIGLYFVSFFIIIVWFGTNIMAALVIDAIISFSDDLQEKDHEPKEESLLREEEEEERSPTTEETPPFHSSAEEAQESLDEEPQLERRTSDLDALFERRTGESPHSFQETEKLDERPQLSARAFQALRQKMRHTRQTIVQTRALGTASPPLLSSSRSSSMPPSTSTSSSSLSREEPPRPKEDLLTTEEGKKEDFGGP